MISINKKKLILFDWGHVIQDGDSKLYNIQTARKKVCDEMAPIYYKKLLEIFDLDEFWTLNGNEFEQFIINKLKESGSNSTFDDFKKSYLKFNKSVPYFKETINLINDLINSQCYIGILSNISELDVIQLKEHLELDKLNYLFLSTYTGIQKPDYRIYKNVMKKTKLSPKNIFLIDNKLENIEAAKKEGWNTCLATGYEIEKISREVYNFINK